MKGTDEFKKTIQAYLEERAANDELFAASFAKENKNIDDCIIHIMETAQRSGCNGFTDPEVYSMAVHYYNEDNIKVGKLPENLQVVVNHHVELTEEEKKEAHQKALQKLEDEAYEKMKKRPAKKNKEEVKTPLMDDLFG